MSDGERGGRTRRTGASPTTALESIDESALLTACRCVADTVVFDALYRRHLPAAQRWARMVAGPVDADDVVMTAFLKVFVLLRDGRGPRANLGAYLRVAIRSAYIDGRRRTMRELTAEDPFEMVDEAADAVGGDELFDRAAILGALGELSPRWQQVLWWVYVEGRPRAWIGDQLGLTPNAVGVLAFRAREGLRNAYVLEHIAATDEDDVAPRTPARRAQTLSCTRARSLLPQFQMKRLAPRRRQEVRSHLDSCSGCSSASGEVASVLTAL